MTQKKFYTDVMLKQTLKKEDRVRLPETPDFYLNLHDRIMTAISNIEIQPASKWSKPWVFLESNVDLESGTVKIGDKN